MIGTAENRNDWSLVARLALSYLEEVRLEDELINIDPYPIQPYSQIHVWYSHDSHPDINYALHFDIEPSGSANIGIARPKVRSPKYDRTEFTDASFHATEWFSAAEPNGRTCKKHLRFCLDVIRKIQLKQVGSVR